MVNLRFHYCLPKGGGAELCAKTNKVHMRRFRKDVKRLPVTAPKQQQISAAATDAQTEAAANLVGPSVTLRDHFTNDSDAFALWCLRQKHSFDYGVISLSPVPFVAANSFGKDCGATGRRREGGKGGSRQGWNTQRCEQKDGNGEGGGGVERRTQGGKARKEGSTGRLPSSFHSSRCLPSPLRLASLSLHATTTPLGFLGARAVEFHLTHNGLCPPRIAFLRRARPDYVQCFSFLTNALNTDYKLFGTIVWAL